MMKRLVFSVICLFMTLASLAQMPELTLEQHLEDYDLAVKYIEDNYAGFPDKVVDSTRADYEAMKTRLREQVVNGERPGYDAVAEYTAWFNDYHTRLCRDEVDSQGNWRQYNDRYWTRKTINYDALMEEYNPTPVACKVTDKTFLIRFPSCYGDPDMEWIEGSIQQFIGSGCEHLILDIRGNGGGGDDLWGPYWELLANHDGDIPDVEFRNTPANRDTLLSWCDSQELQDEMINRINEEVFFKIEHMQFIPGSLIRMIWGLMRHPATASFRMMAIQGKLYRPESIPTTIPLHVGKMNGAIHKAALIIDNGVGSSGEELVRELRAASDRTTIYGRDNTLGCLDYSNVTEVELPNSGIYFMVPMSRRVGLPETGIDATGIAPDVRITLPLPARLTDNIDEWIIWVAEQLEKQTSHF